MAKARRTDVASTAPLERDGAAMDRPRKPTSDGPGFARRYLLRSLEVTMYWMPVWVPLILLAQIGTRGLKPARLEEERLLQHERELFERLENDGAQARELDAVLRSFDDEIYRERLRRIQQAENRAEVEERGLAPRVPEPETD